MGSVIGAVAGAGLAAGAMSLFRVVLGFIGFTPAGIAAESIAAWMMSFFATLGGGGVAAGGLVAFLQHLGAAGLSWAAYIGVTIVGGAVGWLTNLIW
ncbi:interferon alpha-inducible protein 27-like protein 2B [Betta splendens]|uniref:Interferon alpha-inducible protein 27-like protein 2B n=1 Tax=Betta splendens TaxID=158456 RepID=A0A9W2XI92_BETSP|nr:interferon alpha-inducible protein 27-like protein 2B [Betta splendens]